MRSRCSLPCLRLFPYRTALHMAGQRTGNGVWNLHRKHRGIILAPVSFKQVLLSQLSWSARPERATGRKYRRWPRQLKNLGRPSFRPAGQSTKILPGSRRDRLAAEYVDKALRCERSPPNSVATTNLGPLYDYLLLYLQEVRAFPSGSRKHLNHREALMHKGSEKGHWGSRAVTAAFAPSRCFRASKTATLTCTVTRSRPVHSHQFWPGLRPVSVNLCKGGAVEPPPGDLLVTGSGTRAFFLLIARARFGLLKGGRPLRDRGKRHQGYVESFL